MALPAVAGGAAQVHLERRAQAQEEGQVAAEPGRRLSAGQPFRPTARGLQDRSLRGFGHGDQELVLDGELEFQFDAGAGDDRLVSEVEVALRAQVEDVRALVDAVLHRERAGRDQLIGDRVIGQPEVLRGGDGARRSLHAGRASRRRRCTPREDVVVPAIGPDAHVSTRVRGIHPSCPVLPKGRMRAQRIAGNPAQAVNLVGRRIHAHPEPDGRGLTGEHMTNRHVDVLAGEPEIDGFTGRRFRREVGEPDRPQWQGDREPTVPAFRGEDGAVAGNRRRVDE